MHDQNYFFVYFQAKLLCSVNQALKILATQTACCVTVEVCLELMRTDFERAQLKYYNFLRVNNDDLLYDDDDRLNTSPDVIRYTKLTVRPTAGN